jgi:hypothetical protein
MYRVSLSEASHPELPQDVEAGYIIKKKKKYRAWG